MSLSMVTVVLLSASAPASAPADTALARAARRLAEEVASAGAEPPLGVHVVGSPDLARGFGTLLASELAKRKLAPTMVEARDQAEAESAARRSGLGSVVRLTVSLEQGLLTVRGDLVGTWVNFWSGRTPTRPARPAAALEVAVEADGHALALAASPQPPGGDEGPLKLSGALLARLSSRPAAIASGDVDGDGREELAVLTDAEVLLLSPEGKVLVRYEHRHLPDADAPCREPFGAVAVQKGRLAYFSARRARGEMLAVDRNGVRAIASIDRAVLAFADGPVQAALGRGTNTFLPEVAVGKSVAPVKTPFTVLSARRGAMLFVGPDGVATFVRASGEVATVAGFGAGSALADLDGDGQPEAIASSMQFAPDPDELRVYSLAALTAPARTMRRLSEVEPLWQGQVLRGHVVEAVAADVDGDGTDELVLGVWLSDGTGELLLYRRAP